jgi:hypothetical protein
MTFKATFATTSLLLQGTPWRLCVSLLNGEGDSDTRPTANHNPISFVPSTSYFCNQSSSPAVTGTPSNGSSSLPKHFRTHVYIKLFTMFWATAIILQFSVRISGAFCGYTYIHTYVGLMRSNASNFTSRLGSPSTQSATLEHSKLLNND